MIVTVTANPCIDMHCSLGSLVLGGTNRVRCAASEASGKGINVAVALKNLGAQPICTGFNFTENGALLARKLDAAGILHDFVWAEGALRTNFKLAETALRTDSKPGEISRITEINQPGEHVPPSAQETLAGKISAFYDEGESENILVVSGSLPEGVPTDFYAKICAEWHGKVFLDAHGEALRLALDCANGKQPFAKPPFAIKPNISELESTFSRKFSADSAGIEEIAEFCKNKFISAGVEIVCVSMGADGAVLVTRGGVYSAPALDVEVVSTVGAGDAMVAGLVYAVLQGFSEEKYLPAAMAAAAASVVLPGTQMCSFEGFAEMMERWRVALANGGWDAQGHSRTV